MIRKQPLSRRHGAFPHQKLAIRMASMRMDIASARHTRRVGASTRAEASLMAATDAIGLRMRNIPAADGNNATHQTIKAPGIPGPLCSVVRPAYFSELLIEVNLLLRVVPRPITAAMIASEMPAAIRPYSIAVAPDSSFAKRASSFFIG